MKRYTLAAVLGTCSLAAVLTTAVSAQDTNQINTNAQSTIDISDLKPASGSWSLQRNVYIDGRRFDEAEIMDADNQFFRRDSIAQVSFANPENYDRFECSVGFQERSGRGTSQFFVLGDGKPIFATDPLNGADKAVRINVDVHQYKTITLEAVGRGGVWAADSAVWADPRFLQGADATNESTRGTYAPVPREDASSVQSSAALPPLTSR